MCPRALGGGLRSDALGNSVKSLSPCALHYRKFLDSQFWSTPVLRSMACVSKTAEWGIQGGNHQASLFSPFLILNMAGKFFLMSNLISFINFWGNSFSFGCFSAQVLSVLGFRINMVGTLQMELLLDFEVPLEPVASHKSGPPVNVSITARHQ